MKNKGDVSANHCQLLFRNQKDSFFKYINYLCKKRQYDISLHFSNSCKFLLHKAEL